MPNPPYAPGPGAGTPQPVPLETPAAAPSLPEVTPTAEAKEAAERPSRGGGRKLALAFAAVVAVIIVVLVVSFLGRGHTIFHRPSSFAGYTYSASQTASTLSVVNPDVLLSNPSPSVQYVKGIYLAQPAKGKDGGYIELIAAKDSTVPNASLQQYTTQLAPDISVQGSPTTASADGISLECLQTSLGTPSLPSEYFCVFTDGTVMGVVVAYYPDSVGMARAVADAQAAAHAVVTT